MKIAMIAKAEQVKFQALALYHLHVRQIRNTNLSKIRLAPLMRQEELSKIQGQLKHPNSIPGCLFNKRLSTSET